VKTKVRVTRITDHQVEVIRDFKVEVESSTRETVIFKGSEGAFEIWKKTNTLLPTDSVDYNYRGAKVDHASKSQVRIGYED